MKLFIRSLIRWAFWGILVYLTRGGFNTNEMADRWAEVRAFTNSKFGIPD
ncbi:hypothetical protein [Sulfitobacter sp. SK012]|nr:hypothetical protein [Sulfitobacter sp. SK012]